MKNNNCVYFVEGSCEKTLINALKEKPELIVPGRVKVFNAISRELTKSMLVTISSGTTVVFVFDTDVEITEHLKKNIKLVSTYCTGVKVVCLPQVFNLEDELVRCTDVSKVQELTGSKSLNDFKRDFCAITNCRVVLTRHQLDVLRLWTQNVPEVFAFLPVNGAEIKRHENI